MMTRIEQNDSENEERNGSGEDDHEGTMEEEEDGAQQDHDEFDDVMNVFEELEAAEELKTSDSDHGDDSGQSDQHDEGSDENDGNNSNIMTLSGEERRWALEIKATVEDPHSILNLDYQARPVSDMEYGHYALVCKGNLEEALFRMSRTQAFQREYNIDDTPEQGLAIIQRFMNLLPGYLLNLGLCPETNGGLMVSDLAKFRYDQRTVTWDEDCMFHYYCLRITQANFRAIRQGVVALIEASGFLGEIGIETIVEYERRLHDELWAHYPCIARSIRVYNASYAATILLSSMKEFTSDKISHCLQLDCQLEGPLNDDSNSVGLFFGDPGPILTLSDLYLEPNLDEMQNRIIQQCKELLEMRSENERRFRLASSS